ncbi:hypothetical protein F7725_016867 [Dissostichus mawsoni]|uniref:EGF-like domain-containing protein n=1 Tax=Dissostichus mawsoni TaxID=36200 RepID=A0A7J5Z2X6_DISMA|nr:hypothetical protein F7725_016867 [Dissostichus mawsoni]
MHEKARTSLTNLYVPPSACLPGTFGLNCNQVCQCSETNQLCHPVSGLCYCAPGFHGPKCDQICGEGRYGPNCGSECQCENAGRCIPSTGACECPAGFIGARCNISESV